MIKTKIEGVNTVHKKLADGTVRTYYYHRRSGKRLPGLPGSLDFIAAYAAAEAAPVVRHQGTLNGLIHSWTTSPAWSEIAESTRGEYRRMLTRIEERFGTLPVEALEDPAVTQLFLKWRAKIASNSGSREGDNRLSVLSSLLTWAVRNGEITHNHLKGFERLYHSDRTDKIWLPEHIDAFMKAAPLEMQQAMILALHTGQRQGDLRRLAWTNFDGKWITLRQSKTGRKVDIPCTQALKLLLKGMERRSAVVLTTKTGMPWKARYFKDQWAEYQTKAGIKDLHFHDLRGTAVTMLAEAGCSVPEIASITGHSFESATKILETYLSRTRHLASAAIIKFQNAKATRFANRLQTSAPATSRKEVK